MSWGETMRACGAVLTAGYSTVLDCVREPDHEGPHRSFGGSEWGPERRWRDRHGDVWTEGSDGLLHTPETAPFSREHVEKKWGPLAILADTPEPKGDDRG